LGRFVTNNAAFLPLQGIRVLDLSLMYPGGFCTLQLSDLGADVVKLELPGKGDPVRRGVAEGSDAPSHLALNRGKRSATLNLKEPAGLEVLRRLVKTADVLVESQRPGFMEKAGIGYADLSAINPRLIWCSITGFGQDSPYAERPGHELTYLGHSGLLTAMSGDRFPSVPEFFLAGPIAGLHAAVGILAALAERGRTGKGAQIDLSIVDADAWMLSDDVARMSLGQPAFWQVESAQRRVYACADGKRITVAADEPRTWAALCKGMGLVEFADRIPQGEEEQAAMLALLTETFASRPAAEWVETLGADWACVDPVNHPLDFFEDEHLLARGAIAEIADDPDHRRVYTNPLHFVTEEGPSARLAPVGPPQLGADTDEVLGAAGFGAAEIAELRQRGAI
jgi:alpha-methylacyl-CoA racemase